MPPCHRIGTHSGAGPSVRSDQTRTHDAAPPPLHPSTIIIIIMWDIEKIYRETRPDYKKLNVELRQTRDKGIGLFMTEDVKEGRVIAYYPAIVRDSSEPGVCGGMYRLSIFDKDDEIESHIAGDVDVAEDRPLPNPINNLPFWAHFANEPSGSQELAAALWFDDPAIYRGRKNYLRHRRRSPLEPGDTYILELVSLRDISAGEEVTICYGSSYKHGRSYVSACCGGDGGGDDKKKLKQ